MEHNMTDTLQGTAIETPSIVNESGTTGNIVPGRPTLSRASARRVAAALATDPHISAVTMAPVPKPGKLVLLTVLDGDEDEHGNHWHNHGGNEIYAERAMRVRGQAKSRAPGLSGVVWGCGPEAMASLVGRGSRWVLWEADVKDVYDVAGERVWADKGRVILSSDSAITPHDVTSDVLNYRERLIEIEDRSLEAWENLRDLAIELLSLAKGDPLPQGMLLAALRYPPACPCWAEGGIPSRLTLYPYVRSGDVIEFNCTGAILPAEGTIIAAAYNANEGKEDAPPYPTVGALLVFIGGDRELWGTDRYGGVLPLSSLRVLGVAHRHTTPLQGSQTGSSTLSSSKGLRFFFTREGAPPETHKTVNDPKGLAL